MKEPLSVQEMLGEAGAPPTVTWKGKTYTLGFDTQKAKAGLEELVRAEVIQQLEKDCKSLDPETAKARRESIEAKLDRNYYATMQDGWLNRLGASDGSGVVLFVLSLFQTKHPELTVADISQMQREEPAQLSQALKVVAPDFFARAAMDNRGATPEAAAAIAAEILNGIAPLTSSESKPPTASS